MLPPCACSGFTCASGAAAGATCIGMRFGQLEVKAIAARVLGEHRLELPAGHRLEVRQTPTLGPKGGLPVTVRRP